MGGSTSLDYYFFGCGWVWFQVVLVGGTRVFSSLVAYGPYSLTFFPLF